MRQEGLKGAYQGDLEGFMVNEYILPMSHNLASLTLINCIKKLPGCKLFICRSMKLADFLGVCGIYIKK